ncbi:sugar ABC transporter ATP-binding protein [Breznakiella homolactica]|uniref:Sugar ABC transporter ATP-binding protein n=1 Tax=Breznakiella homolactica TaxID=2798577 RepID=A0A7T7XQ36_9SPIR|nr:sugar ABC transporter ATP-binding protein [Breznakiella homolactica]QQO10407.1 sugar ABC transporter ATP-binding protein [Breznakiella homolactica]
MANDTPILRLEGVSKSYYGTTVLSDVNFTLNKGEILGLVGENGAGKTTLMQILFGMPVIADTGGYGGRVYINDTVAAFKSPFDALDAGIGMVHQEFSLIPGFTAAENIMLNREPVRYSPAVEVFGNRLATLRRDIMTERADIAIGKLGVKIAPDTVVAEMPVAHKQFTEIAREIDRDNVRLLVLDEPTAVLTEGEADILLAALKRLAAEGIAIIFISHRLHEVTEISDRIVVLRDGNIIKDVPNKDVSVVNIASWMVGREVAASAKSMEKREFSGTALRVEHLWVDMPGETVRDVSFTVKNGEIFGIGGLAGQGKLGIPNGVMGLYPAGGTVYLGETEIPLGNPKTSLDAGMAFVSEDRRGVGLLLDESLEWNIAFGAMQTKGMYLKSFFGGLFSLRDEKEMKQLAETYIKQLEIKTTGSKQPAKELSGGNQQKVCLAKAFALAPKLLFVSEPTRGIDVGAKKIVLDTLRHQNRNEGTTIVMVSSELEELRSICDRIAIVDEGRIAGIRTAGTAAAEFGLLMSGEASANEAAAGGNG